MTTYDPDPTKPYGTCETCGEEIADRDALRAHFDATWNGNKSHRVRITNPTRDERIEQELQRMADSAMDDFTEEAWDLLDDGVTEDEITEAMKSVDGDFFDAWRKRND